MGLEHVWKSYRQQETATDGNAPFSGVRVWGGRGGSVRLEGRLYEGRLGIKLESHQVATEIMTHHFAGGRVSLGDGRLRHKGK